MQNQTTRRVGLGRRPVFFSAAAAFVAANGLLLSGAKAQVIVNLDATGADLGPLASWTNTGMLGGTFNSAGTVIPQVVEIAGVRAVAITNDNDPDNNPSTPPIVDPNSTYYVGPNANFFIEGNVSRTFEAWIYDNELAEFQTVIAWGRRGVRRAAAIYGYGTSPDGGAVIFWQDDVAYGRNKLVINRWTHVAVAYNNAEGLVRTYVDGFLSRTEQVGSLVTSGTYSTGTHPIRIGRAGNNDGTIDGSAGSNSTTSGVEPLNLARIRVHSGALSGATIRATVLAEGAELFWPDDDNDGLPNWYELQYGLNPGDPSDAATDLLDMDGLTNLEEFDLNTIPNNPDTDGDGATDGAEVNRVAGATDPLNPDVDYDGLLDGEEEVAMTDPFNPDTDFDGSNDPQEVWFGTNPLVDDGILPADDRGPVVQLDFTALPEGPATVLPNTGAMTRDFVPFFPATPGTVQLQPGNVPGLVINGTSNVYLGPPAPMHMAFDGARSGEAWILNPVVAGEETILAWGARGSPDGSNHSFNHGTSPDFGAVGNWGDAYDIGWNGQVVQDMWTHVAYTYEPVESRLTVYRNGEAVNTKITGDPPPITLFTKLADPAGNLYPILLGAQNQANGIPDRSATMAMGKVAIYDRALTADEVLAHYDAEKAQFPVGDPEAGDNLNLAIEYLPRRIPPHVKLTWNWTAIPIGVVPTVETTNDMGTWVDSGLTIDVTSGEETFIPEDPANPYDPMNPEAYVRDPSRHYRFNYPDAPPP